MEKRIDIVGYHYHFLSSDEIIPGRMIVEFGVMDWAMVA